MQNLAAYTAPGSNYPEYLSANAEGDYVTVIMRGPPVDGREGPQAQLILPTPQFTAWLAGAQNTLFRLRMDHTSHGV